MTGPDRGQRAPTGTAGEPFADPQALWDARFSGILRQGSTHTYEPWLVRWLPLFEASRDRATLDLGCGSGGDTRFLAMHGFVVIAADLSRSALRLTQDTCSTGVPRLQIDVRDGLPFRRASFRIIIANLSLHYHRWRRTLAILNEVRQCLESGGLLFARFNSTRDAVYGAQGYPEVERHCYAVNGELKRFFDEADLRAAFGTGWQIRSLEEQVVHCYEHPKTVWEAVVEKAAM